MKSTKKIVSCILLVAVMVISMLSLSGCYIVNSGKLSQIEGTYVLTGYSTYENKMELMGIKLYVIIRADGQGYFAYSDNDTPLYFSPLRCHYVSDTEKSGFYSYVEIDFNGDGEWDRFGIDCRLFERHLNYSKPIYKGNILKGDFGVDYYITSSFDRVSGATDLSYVKSVLGDAELVPYGSVVGE